MGIEGAGRDEVFQINEAINAHQQIQKALMTAIWKDESLRARIHENPKKAIEEAVNIKFDEKIKIKIVDSEEDYLTFTLPPERIKAIGDQVTDAELDNVAGGFVQVLGAVGAIGAAVSTGIAIGAGQAKTKAGQDAAKAFGIMGQVFGSL